MRLESFLCGRWVSGTDEPELLRDASTAEVVAEVAGGGHDFAAALQHARAVGGPALRRLTFHGRAALLKRLAAYLSERKSELYACSYATGATRADAWGDIDGGIGVLFAYASKAVRELPDARVYAEGALEGLSKSGAFIGQHVCVPREGAAVHINAFNFPVWGMLEKLAPTLLAGVPALVKPATSTAYLAALAFRQIIESGVLPEGCVQLLCGGVGDLLEHLRGEDTLAFTGSVATAQRLRAHAAFTARAARFNAETDSLNASILAPDAGPDTPEFALYVREVAREMTAKAGQKCTAIRRALVPRAFSSAVAESLRAALAGIVVGDPRRNDVQMGPLASLAQRREVRAQTAKLQGAAHTLYGPEGLDPRGADPERGAFVAPTLLQCADAHAAAAAPVHEIEAFGPVCTLLPYEDAADAAAIARLGGGSLVSSVFTADPSAAATLVAALAPLHGRILVIDRSCAADSTGHGAPLPHLLHGGPGRAGGGEELGGIRGVLHYMQRTAVQGSPSAIAALTGRWMRGARELDPGTHPFRKPFHALNIGDTFRSRAREVTLEDIERFAELSGDRFYAHMDESEARRNALFGGRVAHGYFLVSAAAGLFVDPAYGPVLANYGIDALRFLKPVRPGDSVRVRLTCKDKTFRVSSGYGEVRWDAEIVNQRGESVVSYDVLTLVSERAIPDAVAS